jgi:hypothetical protein
VVNIIAVTGLAAVVIAGGLMVYLLVRSGARDDPGEVRVSQAAIDAIERYTFVSDVTVESNEGDLHVTYDARSDGAFSSAGLVRGEGDLLSNFDLPREVEVVLAQPEAWFRTPGGEWQKPDCAASPSPSFDNGDPCILTGLAILSVYATPSFFLHVYRFDDPVFQAHDSAEIHGVRAKQVRLNRDDILEFVLQITGAKIPGQGQRLLSEDERREFQEDGSEGLPTDFAIDAWIAEGEGYPVRLVVDFTVPSGDEGLMVGTLPPGASVHLQMDITDPDADVTIEPPAVADQ